MRLHKIARRRFLRDARRRRLRDTRRRHRRAPKAASADQAEQIVAAFMEGNPKMKARVFCHDPQVKKDVDWPSP